MSSSTVSQSFLGFLKTIRPLVLVFSTLFHLSRVSLLTKKLNITLQPADIDPVSGGQIW